MRTIYLPRCEGSMKGREGKREAGRKRECIDRDRDRDREWQMERKGKRKGKGKGKGKSTCLEIDLGDTPTCWFGFPSYERRRTTRNDDSC